MTVLIFCFLSSLFQLRMGRSKSKGSARERARDKDADNSDAKSADIKIKDMLKELHKLVKDVQVRRS